jgi:predicted GNAT superfamily acetyltransferase
VLPAHRALGATHHFDAQVLYARTRPWERRAWNDQTGVTDLQTATTKLSSELAAGAAATALAAADRAGVEIRLLDSVAEFDAASRLVDRVWSDDDAKAPATMLRALSHAGNFVAGAFGETGLVGVSIGFFGRDGAELHLHSHITGIDPLLQNKSLGFALKQFQRSWALERGVASVRWTADPLVRRNLYFNLCKLGASVVGYYADFYGPLLDGVNGSGESDRVLLDWDLASPRAVAAAEQPPLDPEVRPGAVVLAAAADGSPLAAPSGAETLLVWIPDDIVELRQSDPEQADAWREAVRMAIGGAVADGYRGDSITRDGWLLLTR